MAFLSGSVSFSRFKVTGGSPKRLDDNLMDKFRAHAIGKQRVQRSDREEIGWIGGRHLLDREFDVEKNVILDCLHFGLRVDASKVPPEIIRAYMQQEFDALRDKRVGDGRQKVAQLRKQAAEAAKARAEEEVKQGRYRSQRGFPILWDTREDVLYVGSTAPAVIERLHRLFRETFDKRLEPLTAGRGAYLWADAAGLSRWVESAKPTEFVRRPDGDGPNEVYWSTKDPASRDYLGNEFCLWLAEYLSEQSDTIALIDQTEASIVLVKNLTLECPWAQTGRTVSTADAPARLPECLRAMASGKLPRKLGLIITRQQEQYEFTLAAESLAVSGAVLPPMEDGADAGTRTADRVEQVRHLARTLDLIYHAFLARRLSSDWPGEVERIRMWLANQIGNRTAGSMPKVESMPVVV